jgi:hypothetical protein
MAANGFRSSVDPGTIEPATWAAKHFGVGHSAEALARKVNALASDWLEGALAELVAEGLGPDRVTIQYGPGCAVAVAVDGVPRKCWSVAIAP